MSDLRVSFPKPCGERWDEMSPRGCNRHCAACDKVIHDLSGMTVEEVENLITDDPGPCVRALINPDKSFKLASGSGKSRATIVVGAVSFALAACQTPQFDTLGSISGRIVTGEESIGPTTIRARDVDGKIYRAKINWEGKNASYMISGLPAGSYTLSFSETWCGNGNKLKKIDDVKVEGGEVDLGTMEWDTLCVIYIGMMTASPEVRG